MAPGPVEIVEGYRPGMIGRIVSMHAEYYHREHGFGVAFERKVAAGLAEFSSRLDRPTTGLWLAMRDGHICGSIAIDTEDLGTGDAHLRWFITDDTLRGTGTGRALLNRAIDFCDRANAPATQLWTFAGLDAARHLYESVGFTLAEEFTGSQWGTTVTEQRFVRHRPTT